MTEMKFVGDDCYIAGKVVRAEIVVPPGNKLLGIGCHIIQLPDGSEIAVPNTRINLYRHLGRQITYASRRNPTFPGYVDYQVASSPVDSPMPKAVIDIT